MAEAAAVARRYAKALLELGQESDSLDAIASDLDAFGKVLQQNDAELFGVLCHPGLDPSDRAKVLAAVLERAKLNPVVANTLKLVLDKGRFALVPEITAQVQELADEAAGRVRATVTTAEPISDALKSEIAAALTASTAKEVVLTSDVDADLIGGLVIRVGDTVYDASVRYRLQDIKQKLLNQKLDDPAQA